MTGPSEAGLVAKGISVTLGGASILKGVDLTVAPGELVGLIGPNGAGKSTLIRAILGLAPTTAGSVTLDGQPLGALKARDRARQISYAPQGAPVHWPLTVGKLVELGRLPHLSAWQQPEDRDREAVEKALRATDSLHLRDRIATTLSGGERACVMLARAIAVDAPYLLADEPVAALDPYHQLQVMDILRGLASQGRGVVTVLHDLNLALRYCTRLCLLDDGHIAAEGAPSAVLESETIKRVYRVQTEQVLAGGAAFLLTERRL